MSGNSSAILCAIRGPVMLMTVGGLFALNNFTPYGIGSTWPVLLIVFGLLTLACRSVNPAPQPAAPQAPPQYYPPQPPPPAYRQSPYSQTPAATEKGGFGSSAPPRPAAPGQAPEQPGGAS